jgi:hypothetical protein
MTDNKSIMYIVRRFELKDIVFCLIILPLDNSDIFYAVGPLSLTNTFLNNSIVL